LVTNAVLHAHSPSRLEIVRSDDRVRIAVQDSSSRVPSIRDSGNRSSTGRGLMLVDRIALAWGVEPMDPTGKCVWFELATNRAPPPRVQMQR
jgi:anti-sigma regulatory factor (Ser/Thr protein kinase)